MSASDLLYREFWEGTELFEQCVDGNLVLKADCGTWVPFRTAPDALVAQLLLFHQVPVPLVDHFLAVVAKPALSLTDKIELLRNSSSQTTFGEVSAALLATRLDLLSGVLRHPKFDATLITLKDTTELLEHAAAHEQTLVASRIKPGRPTVGIPHVVLEETVASIAADAFPYEELTVYYKLIFEEKWRRGPRADLFRMTLVHRTWTHICQRALHRFVTLRERRDLARFIYSPLCGPWVQALNFVDLHDETSNILKASRLQKDPDVASRFCAALLQRVPNIRFFGCSLGLDSWKNFQTIALKMEGLVRLETIWLDILGDAIILLGNLCVILPSLRNLRFLGLRRGRELMSALGDTTELVDLSYCCPPSSLKSVYFGHIGMESEVPWRHYLDWLLRPRDGFLLLSLFLSYIQTNKRVFDAVSDTLHSCVARLEVACLHFMPLEGFSGNGSFTKCLADVVMQCVTVKTLYLHISLQDFPKAATLPPLLEVLCLSSPTSIEGTLTASVDWKLGLLLSRSHLPHLHTLIWDPSIALDGRLVTSTFEDLRKSLQEIAHKTVGFCAQHEVNLLVDGMMERATFLRDHLTNLW